VNFDFGSLGIWFLVFLFSTTAHEAAHAWVGNRGGSEALGAHVTLDPFVHIQRSPFGMLIVPILSFVSWGWMMGWASVPFDPEWGRRYPRRQALMSLAGPVSNALLTVIGVIAIKVLVSLNLLDYGNAQLSRLVVAPAGFEHNSALAAIAMALSVLVNLNLMLAVFNLLPLPPLDGAHALEGFFPKTVGKWFDSLRSVPVLSLISMVAAWRVFPHLFTPIYIEFMTLVF
jgi:Zn-dependent protease